MHHIKSSQQTPCEAALYAVVLDREGAIHASSNGYKGGCNFCGFGYLQCWFSVRNHQVSTHLSKAIYTSTTYMSQLLLHEIFSSTPKNVEAKRSSLWGEASF